jgi:lipoprotein-anchoring transpeptidase ErfK/SrfK
MRAIEEESVMIRAVIATAATAAALLTGAAAPAAASAASAAAPGSAGAVPVATSVAPANAEVAIAKGKETKLTLGYMAEAGYASALVLTCFPPGGLHPNRVQACNTLKKVHGKPSNLKPAYTMCMMIYAPITAQISGTWEGTKISWSKKYGNVCEMNRATGVLFRF